MSVTYHLPADDPGFRYNPAVVLSIVDLDADFDEASRAGKVIIANDLQVDTEDKREEMVAMLTKIYDSEFLDDPVNGSNVLFDEIDPSVWLKPLTGTYYINPKMFTVLHKFLIRDKFNILQHAIDPSYVSITNLTPKGVVKAYLDAGFPRGMKSFYDNFDHIMQIVVFNQYDKREAKRALPQPKLSKINKSDQSAMMIRKFRDRIFCKHLPIPSRHAFIMEKKGKSKISEVPLLQYAFDAIATITSVGQRVRPLTPKDENRLDFKINRSMAMFYEVYADKEIRSKRGAMRKSTYGTPTSFNARAVIVTRQGLGKYDRIKISYSIGFKIFEQHIGKILTDEDELSPIEIFELRSEYAFQVSPRAHEIMSRLVKEFWGGEGWKCNLLRHPYLAVLSSQCVGIDEVGDQPMDNTIAIPPPLLKGPNKVLKFSL